MKQPIAHVIARQAVATVHKLFPPEWITRNQTEEDYGIDLEVEIAVEGEVTGFVFKVQVKGVEGATRLKSLPAVSYQLEISSAEYLTEQITVPTAFVVCDVKSGEAWWLVLQNQRDFRERLLASKKKGQKSIAIKLPLSNDLATTSDSLLVELEKAQILLSTSAVIKATEKSFADAMKSVTDSEHAITGLQEKVDVLRLAKIDQLFRGELFEEGMSEIGNIVDNPGSFPSQKIVARLYREKGLVAIQKRRSGSVKLFDVRYMIAKEIAEEARTADEGWQAFAECNMAIALFALACERDYDLFTLGRMQKLRYSPIESLVVTRQRVAVLQELPKTLKNVYSLLESLPQRAAVGFIPELTSRMLAASALLFIRMCAEGASVQGNLFREQLRGLADVGIDIAVRGGDLDTASLLIFSGFSLFDAMNLEDATTSRDWAFERVRKLPHSAQERVLETIDETIDDIKENSEESPIERMRKSYVTLAQMAGIDDSSDPRIRQLYEIGLNDLDPTRVLKYCKHLHLSYGPGSIVSRITGNDAAGSKGLTCLMHRFGFSQLSLDGAMSSMKAERCNSCQDRSTHEDQWVWSPEWQVEQDKYYGEVFPDELGE